MVPLVLTHGQKRMWRNSATNKIPERNPNSKRLPSKAHGKGTYVMWLTGAEKFSLDWSFQVPKSSSKGKEHQKHTLEEQFQNEIHIKDVAD